MARIPLKALAAVLGLVPTAFAQGSDVCGSPTVVSKVFGPTPRSDKADMMVVADTSVNDVCLNLLQKIFTTHPTLEEETVERLSA